MVKVLHSAHKYGLNALKEKCGVFLYEQHCAKCAKAKKPLPELTKGKEKDKSELTLIDNDDQIGYLLTTAQKYGCSELERLCAEHLARNFATLKDEVSPFYR